MREGGGGEWTGEGVEAGSHSVCVCVYTMCEHAYGPCCFSSPHLNSHSTGRQSLRTSISALSISIPPSSSSFSSTSHLSPPPSAARPAMLLLYKRFLSLLESIYRRGARRWRKLYRVNGHLFQAKRFNRVSVRFNEQSASPSSPGIPGLSGIMTSPGDVGSFQKLQNKRRVGWV